MAHFYGEIQGNRGEATRMGTKDSGFRGHIRGWHVGGSINCYHNRSKDRDEVSIYATSGSNGGNSTHLATVIETDSGSKIQLNHRLPKLLDTEDWVQLKEDISATIFDYNYVDVNGENRPDEEDCNGIAEKIMKKLNFELDSEEESLNEN